MLEDKILTQTNGYNVSDRYNVIPTMDVIQRFERYGFELQNIDRAGTRIPDKNNKQPHMIRMSSDYQLAPGLRPEVIIHNAYDGTKALNIHIGLFRFACANGIVAGSNMIAPFQVKHSNNNWETALDEFIDGYEEKHNKQKEWVMALQDRRMSLDEAYAFAEEAVKHRHSDKRIGMDVVDPLELLLVKRREDTGTDAWTRFNVIQESITQGFFRKYDSEGTIKKAKVMTNIDEIIRVNSELSNLVTEFAEIQV